MALPNVTSPELIARLTELAAANPDARRLASDGDGTIWKGDIGEALFEAVLAKNGIRDAALAALQAEAEAHDVERLEDPNAQARALIAAFEAGRYPEGKAYAAMAWAFAGWTEKEMAELSDEVLDRFGFERAVHPSMRAVIGWAKARGFEFWLVSASPLPVVQAAGRRLGLPRAHCAAMTPAVEDGVLQPRIDGPPTYRGGKPERLALLAPEGRLLAGFGDSEFDAALMETSLQPVAVCPNQSLLDAAPVGCVALGREGS